MAEFKRRNYGRGHAYYLGDRKLDGVTTLISGGLGVNAMNQFMFAPERMGFDPVKDLDPIILTAKLPFMIAVSPPFAPNNVQELIAAINRDAALDYLEDD